MSRNLSIGIVGLPNVGKSTLFNALTKKSVPSENYPFCTIDPSVGVVGVPDDRLEKLSNFSKSEKTIPAAVEFIDIAGLVEGAAKGEGLGNKFLANIREVDAIAHVVRVFENQDIIHVHGEINPVKDIEIINLELIMADAETVANRIAKLGRDLKRGDKTAIKENDVLIKIEAVLKEEKMASSIKEILTEEELLICKSLHLLTFKPVIYVLNIQSGAKNIDQELIEYFKENDEIFVKIDSATENELKDSSISLEEKKELLESVGIEESGLNLLIQKGYEILGLITFFTTGKDETRAWTTKIGATAPEAGASIHSDFQNKFIKADVIFWDKLLEAGSHAVAREKGWIRTEGKHYIVQDGDVVEFKI
jgi:ribosome-binding ATPase